MDQNVCHNTGRSPAACPYPQIANKFYNIPPAIQIYIWCWHTVWDVLTFYFLHCIIWLKILKLPIHNISRKCLPQITAIKGILLPSGDPDTLDKKMKLLSYFCRYMSEQLVKAGATVHVQECDSLKRVPYLNQWFYSLFFKTKLWKNFNPHNHHMCHTSNSCWKKQFLWNVVVWG